MTDIKYVNYRTNTAVELDFTDLSAFVKGSSITSLAVGDDFIEFGLSDAYNLRISGNDVTLFSTTNNEESQPLRLKIVGGDETPTAALVEQRLHALRQLYAMSFLIDAGREDALAKAFSLRGGPVDLESILEEDDKLLIKSASTGSFWLTVAAKSAAAWSTLKGIGPVFFDEGRQAIVGRARAATELQQIEVDRKRFDTALHKANSLIDLYAKIGKVKDESLRDRLLNDLDENIRITGNTVPTLLAPPSGNKE